MSPRQRGGYLGAALGFLAGSLLRVRRHEVEARLAARGFADPSRVATAMYRQLGRALIELLRLGRSGAKDPPVRLTARAELAFATLVQSREGAVIATAHTGNWDVLACAMAQTLSLSVMTKRLSVSVLDRLWQRLRSDRGVQLLHGKGSVADALLVLSRGGVVAAMIDQVPPRGIVHPFLGKAALHDPTPAILAHRAKRPLIVAFSFLEGGELMLDVPLVLYPVGPSRQFVPEATRLASDALGELVTARPEQWLWLHRRWKGFEKAAPP